MPPRRVRRSDAFLEQARRLFAPGGSVEGRPSFERFVDEPLKGAETALSRHFEAQRQHEDGVQNMRYVMTVPTAFFGPLVISAVLMPDGVVEIVSVIEDPGYWDLVGDDGPD